MKIPSQIFLILACCYLTGCSANAYDGSGGNVRVSSKGIPLGCRFRGNVGVVRKDINGGPAKGVSQEQINELRKQTAEMGGNFLLLTGESSHYYDEYMVATGNVDSELEAQSLQGRAYFCTSR